MMGQLNISELMDLKKRQPPAVEKWFNAFADKLYTFIFYHAGNDPDIAAELVQETFITALNKIDEFDPAKGNMCNWLCLLSRNHISKAMKEKNRFNPLFKLDNYHEDVFSKISTQPLPDELLSRKETQQLVQMAFAKLPDNYSIVLRAFYFHKKSINEIASCLKSTDGAVKTLLHRARKAFEEVFVRLDANAPSSESAGN